MTIDPDVRADDVEPLGESEFATLMGRCLGASASKRIAVGVSGGADSMALTLLAEVAGDDHAQFVQLMTEYDPQPPFNSGSLAKAPDAIRDRALALFA